MIWKHLTFKELKHIDKTTPVILPIGSIEQHGTHLPLMTDALISEFFCFELEKQIPKEMLVLPTVQVCCSEHHMDFCGTLTVSHMTLFNYIQELLECVVRHGFSNMIIFNAHGGNQAIGKSIVESFGMKHKNCNIVFMSWWKIAHEKMLEITEFDLFGVGHACEFETSILQYIDETLVRDKEIKDGTPNIDQDWAKEDLLRGGKALLLRSMKELTANGVFGKASLATREKGEKIVITVLEAYKKIVLDLKQIKR